MKSKILTLTIALALATGFTAAQPADQNGGPDGVMPDQNGERPSGPVGGVGKAISNLPSQAADQAAQVLNIIQVNQGEGLGEALQGFLSGNQTAEAEPDNETQ